MAIISVEVPDKIAKKFTPFTIVKWSDLTMEEQLLDIDWDWWESLVDFWEWVDAKEILSFLQKNHG